MAPTAMLPHAAPAYCAVVMAPVHVATAVAFMPRSERVRQRGRQHGHAQVVREAGGHRAGRGGAPRESSMLPHQPRDTRGSTASSPSSAPTALPRVPVDADMTLLVRSRPPRASAVTEAPTPMTSTPERRETLTHFLWDQKGARIAKSAQSEDSRRALARVESVRARARARRRVARHAFRGPERARRRGNPHALREHLVCCLDLGYRAVALDTRVDATDRTRAGAPGRARASARDVLTQVAADATSLGARSSSWSCAGARCASPSRASSRRWRELTTT